MEEVRAQDQERVGGQKLEVRGDLGRGWPPGLGRQ